jgi:hypothetical protein
MKPIFLQASLAILPVRELELPDHYIQAHSKGLDVTVGNLYEQFGSGMVLRAQEDRFIGIDNSIDGLRVKYDFRKARATGIIGMTNEMVFTIDETNSFGKQNRLSTIEVRGLDLELYLHEIFKPKLTEEEKRTKNLKSFCLLL